MLPTAVIEIAPVPVEPDVGSPDSCQVPFLEKYNLLLVKSNAIPIISPEVKVLPQVVLLLLLRYLPSSL